MNNLLANLESIQHRIALAEKQYQRTPGSVSLLAVSKTHPPSFIETIVNAGQKNMGENYLQEALPKIAALQHQTIVWHFIGRIQSKKTKEIAEHFSWVHTICRLKEALKLSEYRPEHLPPLDVCIQIQLEEKNPQRLGVSIADVPMLVHQLQKLPNLRLRGLMVLPPYLATFEAQREAFSVAKSLFLRLNREGATLDTLSMGMTHDLEAAIAEGATIVRIGTGIFGPRQILK